MMRTLRLCCFVLLLSMLTVITGCQTIENDLPTAVITGLEEAQIGTTVELSAENSFDPNGELLQYDWTLESAPNGSHSKLTDEKKRQVRFTADQPGVYILSLIVRDGHAKSLPAYHYINVNQGLYPLQCDIVDVEYNQATHQMIIAAKSPNQLHLLNLKTGEESKLDLIMEPLCVSVSPNGQYAAVGTSYGIELTDLRSRTSLGFFFLKTSCKEIILTDDGFVYAFDFNSVGVLNTHTGKVTYVTETELTYGFRIKAQLSADQKSIYTYGDGRLIKVRIDTDTVVNEGVQYHQENYLDAGLWLSDDNKAFLYRGEVIQLSNDSAAVCIGQLEGNQAIRSAASVTNNLYVIQDKENTSTIMGDTVMEVYDTQTLQSLGEIDLPFFTVNGEIKPGCGRYIFADDGSCYVILHVKDEPKKNYLVIY